MASWTRHKPSLGLTCPPSERGEPHPCPFRGRLGCACWGTRGSGWIPQVENPGYAEISQTSSAGDVDFVSWFLFILEGGVGGICRKIGRCGSRRGGTTDFHHVFRERDRNRRGRNEPPIASNGALDRIKPPMPLRIRRKTGRAAEARTSKKKARRNDQLRKRDPPFTPGVRAC